MSTIGSIGSAVHSVIGPVTPQDNVGGAAGIAGGVGGLVVVRNVIARAEHTGEAPLGKVGLIAAGYTGAVIGSHVESELAGSHQDAFRVLDPGQGSSLGIAGLSGAELGTTAGIALGIGQGVAMSRSMEWDAKTTAHMALERTAHMAPRGAALGIGAAALGLGAWEIDQKLRGK